MELKLDKSYIKEPDVREKFEKMFSHFEEFTKKSLFAAKFLDQMSEKYCVDEMGKAYLKDYMDRLIDKVYLEVSLGVESEQI